MSAQQSTNITWHGGEVTRADRERLLGQRGVTLWLTGLSGAGKSTIAVILERMLLDRGRLAYRLDGDNVRHGLNKNLGFAQEDRAENIRRVGEVAKLFTDAGVIVIASFISPYRRDREAVRGLMRAGNFVEVYVKVSVDVAERRDPKGLYRKARAGEIKGFTGIDDPYEVPEKPEIVIETEQSSPGQSAAQIITHLASVGVIADPPSAHPERLDSLFANLDRWRHLPSYQLERRADAFFGVYIRELLQWHLGDRDVLQPTVIPELPLKQETSHRSDKVDYVLFSQRGDRVYFVELKTDEDSIRAEQAGYLKAAQGKGFAEVLAGLKEIFCRTGSRGKYFHLLHALERAGCITMAAGLKDRVYAGVSTGRIDDTCFSITGDPKIEVIFIRPGAGDVTDISFNRVLEFLSGMNDPFTVTFRTYLARWQNPAGTVPPELSDD